jgi:hypothetical protein
MSIDIHSPSVSQAEIAALTLTTPGDPTAKCRISSSRAQRHSAHFSQALMAAFHVVSSQGLRESNGLPLGKTHIDLENG